MRFTVHGKWWVAHCPQSGCFKLFEGYSLCTFHSHSQVWQELSTVFPLYRDNVEPMIAWDWTREVILHLGDVVPAFTLRLAAGRNYFCCLCCGKSSQRLQIPSLPGACNGFAMPLFLTVQRVACPLFYWSVRVIKLWDPDTIITRCLFISPLQGNRI